MAFERLEGGRDILASSDLGCDDFEPEWPAVVWTSAISSICKYDRNNRCGLLCRDYRSGRVRDDDIDFAADELVRDLREPLATSIRPAIFDRDGATFDPAEFAQPCTRAATQLVMAAPELALKSPIVGSLAGCARPVSGHAMTARQQA